MSGSPQQDADFFTSMWQSMCEEREAAEARESGEGSERRRSQRFPFDSFQLAALFEGPDMPSIDRFKPVHCHDLSQGAQASDG